MILCLSITLGNPMHRFSFIGLLLMFMWHRVKEINTCSLKEEAFFCIVSLEGTMEWQKSKNKTNNKNKLKTKTKQNRVTAVSRVSTYWSWFKSFTYVELWDCQMEFQMWISLNSNFLHYIAYWSVTSCTLLLWDSASYLLELPKGRNTVKRCR